ncbi:MAG: helix-turn-helix transcriptional regulator [Ruminococcaceae bacterium]|nr:helix-turn-helix transcriptional regulator [Oscillospiraceae bacterium]
MNAKEAVAKRITELCSEREMTINAVANNAGISPSTIYSMLNYKSKNPGVVSLHKICYGFDMTLREFFNSDIFDDVEFEDD